MIFFFITAAAFIADDKYFHWHVWVVRWPRRVLQCGSMQPAPQMAWPFYLKPPDTANKDPASIRNGPCFSLGSVAESINDTESFFF